MKVSRKLSHFAVVLALQFIILQDVIVAKSSPNTDGKVLNKASGKSNNAKKKTCLIVSIDNRELSPNINDNQYPPMTAVLNLDYAKHHNYDFVYVQNVVTDLEKETRLMFPNSDIIPPTDNAKDAATAFHVGLKQFRAASWAKLPALWHVTTTIGIMNEIFLIVYLTPLFIVLTAFIFRLDLNVFFFQVWTMNTYGTLTVMLQYLPCSEISPSNSK